jgi:glycosyltransferase involved in cell wall biosynthesis
VAFVGRLVDAKGVWDAIDAWRRSDVGLPLVFAGTGALRDAVEKQGLAVLGWLPHDRLARLLARARALLMPSRWQEPFGIAGLEALSVGVPVVAWQSGGIREWHPGPLVDWGDVDSLADNLRAAIGSRAAPPSGFERSELMSRLLAVCRDRA